MNAFGTFLRSINKPFYDIEPVFTMVVDTYMKMFQALLPANLEEMAKKEKGTVKGGVIVYALAWLVSLVLGAATLLFAVTVATPEMHTLGQLIGLEIVGFMGLVVLLITSVIGMVWGLASQYVSLYAGSWAASSLFKGKGKFEQLFYIVMLFTGAIMIISAFMSILNVMLPMIMAITGIISLLLGLWALFLLYLAIRKVFGLELAGAVVSTLVVLIVGIVFMLAVAAVVALVLVTLGLGAIGGAAAAGGLAGMGI